MRAGASNPQVHRILLLLLFVAAPLPAPLIGGPGVRDWQEATDLERLLESRPADADARRKLLAWYTLHYRDLRAGRRLEHILWTIRHQPELRLSDSRSLRIDEGDPAFADVTEAWEAQLRRRPNHAVVLLRAAEHLLRAMPERAEAWLHRVQTQARARLGPDGLDPPPRPGGRWWTWSWVDGEVTRLQARLYVDGILGVTARSPSEAPTGYDPAGAQSQFARAARRKLDGSVDARLLAEAAWWLHLAEQGRPQPSAWGVTVAWSWFQRAERLDPGSHAVAAYQDAFQQHWSRQQPPRLPAPVRRVRRTGANAPQPIFTVRAACPVAARAVAPPEGLDASFRLILRPDGTVRFALLEGSHRAAVGPAAEAVRQWRFAPQSDGSIPVETETRVRVRVCGPKPGEQNLLP